jgi:outer membrane protein OmpA-like peptidoglycan-associated protein
MTFVTIVLALTISGCATKKFVRQQTGAVNAHVSSLETKTNEQISYLHNKEQNDISRVNELIATTDNRLNDVTTMAQQAGVSAGRANQLAQANEARIEANSKQISAMQMLAESAWNFQVIEKGNVTFAFNKSTLDNDAMLTLDRIAQKASSTSRAVVELEGFTDKVGSKDYNLALSRRRAEAVARYLVQRDVPLRGIHIIGFGEEKPPAGSVSDTANVSSNPTAAELRRLARRVSVRVYAPMTASAGEAARQQ